MSTGAMSPPAGDPNMRVTKPPTSPTSGVIVAVRAQQVVIEAIGLCHRQALWCGRHHSVWPHGQDGGCNDFVTALEAAEALIARG